MPVVGLLVGYIWAGLAWVRLGWATGVGPGSQVESLEFGWQAGRLALNLNSGASRFYSQKASQYID